MKSKTVGDVMTTQVVTISRSTPFKDIVRLMQEHGVSALPVIDPEHRPIGIVSEADLLLKSQDARSDKPSLAMRLLHGADLTKAVGLVAHQVMTTPVLVATSDASLVETSRVMHDKHLKHLPVVDADGVLVGIVSRADLLSVFLRSDEGIRAEVLEVIKTGLWIDDEGLGVEVHDGIVGLTGQVTTASIASILVQLVRRLDGVVGVEDHLTFSFDDRSECASLGRSRAQHP